MVIRFSGICRGRPDPPVDVLVTIATLVVLLECWCSASQFLQIYWDARHQTLLPSRYTPCSTLFLITWVVLEVSHVVEVQLLDRSSLIWSFGELLVHERKKSWLDKSLNTTCKLYSFAATVRQLTLCVR